MDKLNHTGFCLGDYDEDKCKDCPSLVECIQMGKDDLKKAPKKPTWLYQCNPIEPGHTFPKDKRCLICGNSTWDDYFSIQYHHPEHDHVPVHIKCFETGEFKFDPDTKTIFWMHIGG